VKRVYDHEDLIGGAQLKDILEANLRQITSIVELSPPAPSPAPVEIIAWELSYKIPETKETKVLSGTVSVRLTDDDKLLAQNSEVLVASKSQEAGDFDKKVLELIDAGRYEEAIIQKNIAVELLKEVVDIDKTGFISVMLKKAEKHLADLKGGRNKRELRLSVGYDAGLFRRYSFCAIREAEISGGSAAPAPPVAIVPIIQPPSSGRARAYS